MGRYLAQHPTQMVASYWFYAKKKSYGYIERCEEKRSVYLDKINTKDPKTVIYLDESGIDDNETYDYSWGPKGPRIYALKPARRKKRLSIISAIQGNRHVAPLVFEGTCDREVFEMYLEKVLIPQLAPGHTLVMDNATFHKGGRIQSIMQEAKCDIVYLPPYSPDLNPIEHHWSSIKHHIRQRLPFCDRNLYDAASYVFQNVLN